MILTNENNNATTFEGVDIIESFDDIINRFPSPTETSMPGIKIYGDNTDQSKAKNIKLFNDARRWRNNYISNNGLIDTGQKIRINVGALMIDNIIMDEYDSNYQCYIDIYDNIYDNIIELYKLYDIKILTISNDGLVTFNHYNIYPSPIETAMPGLYIFTNNDTLNNMSIYENFQRWREDYISLNELNDYGQIIRINVDALRIDVFNMDEYDNSYNYHINIAPNSIMLLNNNSEEILTISSDGSVTILDIFNKFLSPSDRTTKMPGIKIYTDNTIQSKAENVKLYNAAQEYRNNYISYHGLGDTFDVFVGIDALIIDNIIIDKYDGEYFSNYNYCIYIYNDHIILIKYGYGSKSEILTIFSDGSVEKYITPTPTPTPVPAR